MTDARSLATALGGRWHGRHGSAPCPVCQPERRRDQNALSLADGSDERLLLNCKKSACAFSDILASAGVAPSGYTPPDPATIVQRKAEERAQIEKRARQAERSWQETWPITGSIAETYLRGRGITCDLPGTLRFHPSCWHGPTATPHPALVAAVDGSEDFGIHRTYLRPDGSGKADIDRAKLMLGATAGGAVRLNDAPGPLVVAEGIETALSLASGLLSRPSTIWAALSASGLRGLRLPAVPGRLTIACDGDTPGREAANALAERALALGWAVGILDPGDARDWNDLLTTKEVAP